MAGPVVERLARIETKLDTLILTIGDHEKRVRKLEKRIYAIPGGAVVVAALGVVVAVFGNH